MFRLGQIDKVIEFRRAISFGFRGIGHALSRSIKVHEVGKQHRRVCRMLVCILCVGMCIVQVVRVLRVLVISALTAKTDLDGAHVLFG